MKPNNLRNQFITRTRAKCAWKVFALFCVFLPIFTTEASVANTISFQGRLFVDESDPAANTSFDLRFSLWPDSDFTAGVDNVDGSLVGASWIETQTITTDTQGFFITNIGSVTPLPEIFDATLHQYLQTELKVHNASNASYFVLDSLSSNDTVDRKSIIGSVYAQNSARLDGRKLGFNPGEIPYLDPTTGKINRSLITVDNWLDPVADESAMNNITSPQNGDIVFVQSTKKLYAYDGSTWINTSGGTSESLVDLETLVNNNSTAITTEKNRAESAEGTLTTNLGNEVTRATNAESALSSRVTVTETNISTNTTSIAENDGELTTLNADVNTVGSVLKSIKDNAKNAGFISGTGLVSTSLGTAIDEVNTNLSNAIQGLTWKAPVSEISDLSTTYSSPVNGDSVYVTGVGEIYTYNGSDWVKISSTSAQDAAISTLETDLNSAEVDILANTTAISTEQSRAEAAELTLTTNLGNEVTRATNAENALDGRMTTAETTISNHTTDIASNDGELTTLKADVTTAGSILKSIKDTAKNAVFTSTSGLSSVVLGTAIDEVNTDLNNAKSNITSNTNAISSETTRATNAEGTLTTNLGNEVTRATGAEDALDTRITTNAISITTNNGKFSTLNGDISTDGSILKSIKDTGKNASFDSSTGISATSLGTAIDEVNTNWATAIGGLHWKSPVTNVGDLTTTYTSAVSGDIAYVTSTNDIYTYNGSSWVEFSPDGDTSKKGLVQFAADEEVAALKAIQSNDTRLSQIGTNATNIDTNAANIAIIFGLIDGYHP